MINDVQQRIVKARNEVKAQKVASKLAYSSILFPENTPRVTWSGTINFPWTADNVIARLRVRFTRNDGMDGAPFVDFAQNVTFSPTYVAYSASVGWIVTGNDTGYVDDQEYTGYVAATGSNYVDYYIDFLKDIQMNYNTLNSISASVEVEAISMVDGTLTITRIK